MARKPFGRYRNPTTHNKRELVEYCTAMPNWDHEPGSLHAKANGYGRWCEGLVFAGLILSALAGGATIATLDGQSALKAEQMAFKVDLRAARERSESFALTATNWKKYAVLAPVRTVPGIIPPAPPVLPAARPAKPAKPAALIKPVQTVSLNPQNAPTHREEASTPAAPSRTLTKTVLPKAPRLTAALAAPIVKGAAVKKPTRQKVQAITKPIIMVAPVKAYRKLAGLNFDLPSVRTDNGAVPRTYLDRFPVDMSRVGSVRVKKEIFIKTILPLVLRANEEISAQRARLLAIKTKLERGANIGAADIAFLDRLHNRYDVPARDLEELARRVDIVPPSLTLAQAAEESGWGTSRFVRKGNALFGQRSWSAKKGIVPHRRAVGETYVVRQFGDLYSSVRSYMRNLNTHRAYQGLRARRSRMTDAGAEMDVHKLVGELIKYSERGEEYIKTIRTIMRVNRLREFDDARLSPRTARNDAIIEFQQIASIDPS